MDDDLKFAGTNPVTINYNGSSDDIYAPISTRSCDVTIVNDKILDDLYTPWKDDILIEIERKEQAKEKVIYTDNPGSATSLLISYTSNEEKERVSSNLGEFYTDINGAYRYQGDIEPVYGYGTETNRNLVYNKVRQKWMRDDSWDLESDQGQYFHDATDSYKMVYDSGHLLYKWVNGAWGSAMAVYGDNVASFDNRCIYTYTDGVTEYFENASLENTHRYLWNPANRSFDRLSDYVYTDGPLTKYDITYRMKIKDEAGQWIDICVIDYWTPSSAAYHTKIVKMNRQQGTFTTICELLTNSSGERVFAHKDGSLYCMRYTDGSIWYWSWVAEDWVQFLSFTDISDVRSNSFTVDYVIDGEIVVCKCKVLSGSNVVDKYYYLADLVHPEIKARYDVIPGQYVYRTLFSGYMVPNTYSQPVTQNLDQITVTGIDFLSILKYVTIDKLFSKPSMMSYGEIISLALAYVTPPEYFYGDYVHFMVENCVTYGGEFNGSNGLMDMRIQVSNFWDESEKPATAYQVIEELLKPFCMRLIYNGGYVIYNVNNTNIGGRSYINYRYTREGVKEHQNLVEADPSDTDSEWLCNTFHNYGTDWISNNLSDATIEINSTYDNVKATASTCVPSYSKMAMDLVDYSQREKYDAGWGNVQVNKTKGYLKETVIITIRPGQSHPATIVRKDNSDHWFYLWNGVYTNPEYELVPYSYDPLHPEVEWYRNVNKFYEYLEETTTAYGAEYGQMLTFQGGGNNPTGTDKTQAQEKSVEVKKRVTAYAPDNGVPPEFLETSDLGWTLQVQSSTRMLNKTNPTSARFGDGITMQSSNRCVYKQVYENVSLSSIEDNVVNIDLTQSYSRTGIDVKIDVMNNNTATDKVMTGNALLSCNSDYFPVWWDADQVTVDSYYFRRYASDGGGNDSCRAVWDERIVKLYVEFSDGTFQMFNGKAWVTDGENHANPFILTKMITGEKLYHNEMKYNCIKFPSDPINVRYSLTGEDIYIYYDNDMGVTDRETNDYTRCKPYNSEENAWYKWIAGCGEGQLSIRLPYVDDPSAKVYVEIWNSSILGMTGTDSTVSGAVVNHSVPFYYTLDDQYESTQNFQEVQAYCNFLPNNVSHVKAEHLDLSIKVTVPESNLGQMFSQSDIEYEINSGKNYEEEFNGLSFQVNTKNQLVASSYSYLMYNSGLANPDQFIINNIGTRPECFTVQAYFNWLTRIRKIYTKTILPLNEDRMFNNTMKFIESPEIGENPMMVVSDSWDVKSGRHTVVSVECQDLDVGYIDPFMVNELPRKARAERWNLPTANKNS